MRIIRYADAGGKVKSLICRVEDSSSGQCLDARVQVVGEDLVVAVGGGERPHVGCVVLAQPHPAKGRDAGWSASCSVLTIPPHKEEPIARGIAEKVAASLGQVVVVTAGVHDDDIDAEGIATYLRLGEELAEKLVDALG
jgi:hypothetical protein